MSFEAMTWAVKQDLPVKQKMVLLMLANRTNADTGRCDPSHRRLAFDCGMSHSSVKRAIQELADLGYLEVEPRAVGDVQLPNQYLLCLPGENLEGVGSHRPGVGSHRPGGVGSHRPTKQEDIKQEDNLFPPGEGDGISCTDVRDAYNRICPPVFPSCRIMNTKRKKHIEQMLHLEMDGRKPFLEHGIVLVESFFHDCMANPFWRGENTSGWKADFDFVIRPANVIKVLERSLG